MDSREFGDWVAYSRIDPFGNERLDLHAAMILSMLFNINRGKQQAKDPSDFMPDFSPPAPAGEQVLSIFKQIKEMQ